MKVSEAIDRFIAYHEPNWKKTTTGNCDFLLSKFRKDFGDRIHAVADKQEFHPNPRQCPMMRNS